MLALSSGTLLRTGSEIIINGLAYRLVVLGANDTDFAPPDTLPGGQKLLAPEHARIHEGLEGLRELCQRFTALNERLLDPLDGLTGRALELLMSAREVEPAFRAALVPYAFAVFKHGCNVLTERGSVVVPPLPREEFQRQVQRLPAQLRGSNRWKRVLDHLFDPVPLITQGFYLFERPDDRLRFEATLGKTYADVCTELRAVFADAIERQASLPRKEWMRLDELSQRALELQKAPLASAIEEAEPDVRRGATRVRVRCYDDGQLRLWSVPFSLEFERELDECAALIRKARTAMPASASQLRQVMLDLASWCQDRSDSDDWAESRPSWIAADDPSNLLDVSLTVEEKVSRLGAKGGFQIVVSAFDAPPGATRSVYEIVREEGRRKQNLNVLFLRHVLVGGGASNSTLAGEKLPDPDGRERYKVMTFTNAVRGAMVRANAPLILRATEWPEHRLAALEDAASVLVLLHEYGHTLGDYAELLGDIGTSVEETNADASALYQTRRLAPDHLDALLHLGACWMPVQRALQGPTEAHSHADLVIFEALRAAGAIAVVDLGDRWIVRLLAPDVAVSTAFTLALQMRLWEAGIPTGEQGAVTEPFDPDDRAQDGRIAGAARGLLGGLREEQRARWRQQAAAECKEYFSLARLRAISLPLEPVLASMPRYQSVAVIPTDRRIAALVTE